MHIISVGGGISSTILLPLEVAQKYGAENVELVIAALANEHPDVWELVAECERLTGLAVKRLSYCPEPPYYAIDAPASEWWSIWDIFHTQGMMGNSLADPCSRLLKRETIRRYLADFHPPELTTLHLGITADEIDRELAIRKAWHKSGYAVEFDLIDHAPEYPLDWQPELYGLGFRHNNCDGFCVKAGHAQIARLLWYRPEVYHWHEQNEIRFQIENGTKATIMRDRKTRGGITDSYPLSLTQFRERMESRWGNMLPGFDPFDELEDTPACHFCEAMG